MIIKIIELILTILTFFKKSKSQKHSEAMAELEAVLDKKPESDEEKWKKADEEAKWLGKRL